MPVCPHLCTFLELHNQDDQYFSSSMFLARSGIKRYYYYISTSYALLHDFSQASLYFKLAIDHGWTDVEDYQKCELFDDFRKSLLGQQIMEILKGKESMVKKD